MFVPVTASISMGLFLACIEPGLRGGWEPGLAACGGLGPGLVGLGHGLRGFGNLACKGLGTWLARVLDNCAFNPCHLCICSRAWLRPFW